MTAVMTRKAGHAMAVALDRVNNDPAHLRQEIERLQQEIKRLQALIVNSHTSIIQPAAAEAWEQIGWRHYRLNDREAGTQVELARRLGVQSYDVCKWVKDGRLKTVTTPDDRQSVWLDQSRPSRKKKQQKKQAQ
jgi:hypothetical protein